MSDLDLAESGKRVVRHICQTFPPKPSEVVLPCQQDMKSDVFFLIDFHSLVDDHVTDLVSRLLKTIMTSHSNDLRHALVVHHDDKPPQLYVADHNVDLNDVIWMLRQKTTERSSSEVDLEPAFSFMANEVLLPHSEVEKSTVIVAITSADVISKRHLYESLDQLTSDQTSVLLVAANGKDIEDRSFGSPLLTGLDVDGVLSNEQVVKHSNKILQIVCDAPKKPAPSAGVCAADMEIVFVLDDYVMRNAYPEVVNKLLESMKLSFKDKSKWIKLLAVNIEESMLSVDGYAEVTHYNYDASSGSYNLFLLKTASEYLNSFPQIGIRTVILLTEQTDTDSDVKSIEAALSEIDASVVNIYFSELGQNSFPELGEKSNLKHFDFGNKEQIRDERKVTDLMTLACTQVEPEPVYPPVEPDYTCPAGEITFLYDVALFSPPRDARIVTSFMERVMKLIGFGSTHARASKFNGISFGSTAKEEFSVSTDDYIQFNEDLRNLNAMSNEGNSVPLKAAKALRYIIKLSSILEHSISCFHLLLIFIKYVFFIYFDM